MLHWYKYSPLKGKRYDWLQATSISRIFWNINCTMISETSKKSSRVWFMAAHTAASFHPSELRVKVLSQGTRRDTWLNYRRKRRNGEGRKAEKTWEKKNFPLFFPEKNAFLLHSSFRPPPPPPSREFLLYCVVTNSDFFPWPSCWLTDLTWMRWRPEIIPPLLPTTFFSMLKRRQGGYSWPPTDVELSDGRRWKERRKSFI